MKKALILGVSGQDGQLLAELLLSKGYFVLGVSRENFRNNLNIQDVGTKFQHKQLSISNTKELIEVILNWQPNEIYNLAGLSSPAESLRQSNQYMEINAFSVERLLLEIYRECRFTDIRFYQATSSEIFSGANHSPQNENSALTPTNPYGESKAYILEFSRQLRKESGVYIACGIPYNHESELRSNKFVSRKITQGIANIKFGNLDKLRLGNIHSKRDWGYARDYVYGMWLMLQQNKPDDFILATGIQHSVLDFLTLAMEYAKISKPIADILEYDVENIRNFDSSILKGDITKAQRILNWSPTTSFPELVSLMVSNDLRLFARNHE